MYKLYCSVLLHRLERWVDVNDLLVDEQNGFRRGRSCVDHISSLSSIIETRKLKKCTYAAFIDFSKAYDRINRNMLFSKLSDLGLKGNFYESMKAIYSNVRCSVKVNGVLSDSFNVSSGLKQGCLLSPMLFNLYLNDLAVKLKSLGCGINIDGEVVPIILYADDIVLFAENEQDLQQLLNVLNEWCEEWDMVTNLGKSNVTHFRNSSVSRTNCEFHIGNLDNNRVQVVDRYRYLGIVLNDFLDFSVTARVVADAAHRALGLLISKEKIQGGMPYKVFTKLYNALVQSIIDYGVAIWGYKEFSSINAVQNRACRYFLGVGKYTPTAAV